jgi:hypothetical protein
MLIILERPSAPATSLWGRLRANKGVKVKEHRGESTGRRIITSDVAMIQHLFAMTEPQTSGCSHSVAWHPKKKRHFSRMPSQGEKKPKGGPGEQRWHWTVGQIELGAKQIAPPLVQHFFTSLLIMSTFQTLQSERISSVCRLCQHSEADSASNATLLR